MPVFSSQRSHHRHLHIPRLTGFRRPSQSAAASHGKVELVEAEESFQHPHHYHAYDTPTPAQHDTMSTHQPQQRHQRVRFANETEPTHAHHNRTHSSSNGSSSTANFNPTSTSSSRTSFDLEPTSPVAEWCHQMHIMQRRRYDWCQACFPRPVQAAPAPRHDEEVTMAMIEARRAQMVERVRRERQAAHAYQ